jgi:DNA helicase-2/ATP-dependent DNA helicase PcrA
MFVVDKIKDLVASGDEYSDIAVLYRANYISRNFEDMLIRYKIPYTIYGGLSFFQRKEIKDIIAYLRLMVNYNDDFSFRRVVNEPKRKIGPAMLEKLTFVAQANNVSLLNAIPLFNNKSQSGIQLTKFYNTIIGLNQSIESVDLRDLVEVIMEKTNYEDSLKVDEDSYADRMENIKELKTVLKETDEFYFGTNQEKLEALLSDLALRTDNDDSKKDKGVILSTYHQVKGLEFKNVFMVAMEEEIFPSMNSVLEAEIEEERRICYVGITRAKDRLYISHSSNRFLFGFQRSLAPSRFLKDMGDNLFENKKPLKVENKVKEEQKVEKNTSDNEYKTGDKVSHKVFGDGMVVSTTSSTITVAFKVPYGIKTLFANHPAIRKI